MRAISCTQVSFRDEVWPHLNEPALANRLWGARVHPNWQVQQLLADVLVYFIQKSFARFLEVRPSWLNSQAKYDTLYRLSWRTK